METKLALLKFQKTRKDIRKMGDKKNEHIHKSPTLSYAVITLSVLITFIVIALRFFNIPIGVAMILSWFILYPFATKLGYSLKEVEANINEMIKVAISVIVLFYAVGCMVSIWISAGTIPTLIYWGLKLISPKVFLPVCFILCVLVAIPTGTSWGTMSTIGVAMMGVGVGLGIPAGMIAGAVVSGASFGNTISPASDCAMLTVSVSGVQYGDFLKRTLKVHIPAFALCTAAFFILGITSSGSNVDLQTINEMLGTLEGNFKLVCLVDLR